MGGTMFKRGFALLWLFVVTVQPSFADDREKVVGIWKLVSWENEFQDSGERRPMYGKNPKGYIILTQEGRMMAVLEGEGRKVPQTDEERLAAFRTIVAYTGIYRVEGDKWITKVDASWNPAWNGTEQVRTFKLEGDRLSVISMWQPNANLGGKTARGVLTWVREK
jgi:hypothetical protein